MGVGVALLGLAAAGGGAYLASQGSGQSRSTAGELGGMPVGMYGDHLEQMADIDFDNRLKQAGLTMALYPKFAQMQRQEQNAQAKQALRLYPQFAAAERAQTGAQRRGDLADFQDLGGQYASLYESLSPGYARLDEEISGPRDTRILDRLRGDALSELDLGTALSPDELRDVIQSSRAAFSDRGLYDSNPSVVAEVLNRSAAGRARQGERRQFAMGVQNMDEASTSNRINQLIAGTQARLSPILGAMGGRTGVNPTISAGPASMAMQPGSVSNILSQAPSVASMSGAISPLYSYGADVANTNFNAAEARAMGAANALASAGGGMMSYGGSMYGAR